MAFTESKIIEILQKLPSEAPNLDYKEMPYQKWHDLSFIKDVLAMLNTEAVMEEDKFIICGVDNSKKLKGIEEELWRDDNEWQNLLNKILPRPIDVRTGTVTFDDKLFGYIYISPRNNEWVYEAGETIFPKDGKFLKESNTLFRGQALTRRGSTNDILYSKDRQRLLEKKIQSFQAERPIIIKSDFDENLLGVLGLIGAWDENHIADKESIEKLTGSKAELIIEKLRKHYSKSQEVFSFSNGVWKIKNQSEVLLQEADKIYDNHIELFFEIVRKCFFETDSKYNLPEDKRYAATLYTSGEETKYSKVINKAIAETLAILGNNQELFIHCSTNKILNELCIFEREFFKADDWKVFATEADNFQFLGEACPSVFLDEVIRLTSEEDNSFLQFLNEREQRIFVTRYGYQLSWVISNIAKLEKYFSKAMYALFQLAKIHESFVDTMVGIVLPWYPQTHAPITIRVGVLQGLVEENNNLAWKVLMKLMPRVTTTGSPIQKPAYLKVDDIPETVSQKDYIDATVGYINLAIDMIRTDINKMCDLFSVINDVDSDIQDKIISKMVEGSIDLSKEEIELLWNKAQDFLLSHRKFSDANWALQEERLLSIENFAAQLLPGSEHATAIRLFREDQYSLFEEKGNFQSEEEKLRDKQRNVLNILYTKEKVNGILAFSDEVENKGAIGVCISSFVSNDDILYIISKSKCIEKDALIRGLFLNLDFVRIAEIIQTESDEVQAKILAILPLTEQSINKVKRLKKSAQRIYWSLTSVWGFGVDNSSIYETAVNNLNEVRRPDRSIFILYNCIKENNMDVELQLVIDTLNLNVETAIRNTNTLDEYYIQHLIKWLQNQKIDNETMVLIEWKYLVFLQENEEYLPVFLWNELSSNPDFYIKVLKLICGKSDDFNGMEEEKSRVVSQCYKLMYGWKKVPGVCMDGTFDKEILDNWMKVVVEKSKEFSIDSFALNYFGQAAFHAPKDKDGFFIERNVAKYLHNDKEGHALSGYHSEAFNSRGVHTVDITGETEFTIEAEYLEKASFADEAGMFRFAATLRKIAYSYHEEGKRNIEEGRYWAVEN